MARLSDSVAPEVKMRSRWLALMRLQICSRASSMRCRVRWPKRWTEEGFAQSSVIISVTAWTTSGVGLVVALLSR